MTQATSDNTMHHPSQPLLEQAAGWFVLLASGEASEEDRSRWHAWVQASPEHARAWQRAESSVKRFAEIPSDQTHASFNALTRIANRKPAGRHAAKHLLVILVAGIAGWFGYQHSDWSADMVAAHGAIEETILADGSRIMLDSGSVIDIDYSATERVIHLRRGRILVETGKQAEDQSRTFAVETAEGRVVALGTRFTVRQADNQTLVSVLADRVAIEAKDADTEGPLLTAGQSARFDRSGLLVETEAQPADTAWTRGMLIANDMSLTEFVAELSPYSDESIRLDPAVEMLRISGSFPLQDTDRVLTALGDTLPLRIEREHSWLGGAALVIKPK